MELRIRAIAPIRRESDEMPTRGGGFAWHSKGALTVLLLDRKVERYPRLPHPRRRLPDMGVVMNDSLAGRAKFGAPIYGSMEDGALFKDGPPLFVTVTGDDSAVPGSESLAIFLSWSKAQLPAELHVYERGGHGFGMHPLNLSVDGGTAAYEIWLKSYGSLGEPSSTQRPAQ